MMSLSNKESNIVQKHLGNIFLRNAKPFLKWAGGKQQLLPQFESYYPKDFLRYIEPFVGGGAIFFHLWNTFRLSGETLLTDNNSELINAYKVVRDNLEELIGLIAYHKKHHNRDYFYKIRNLDRQNIELNDIERAARLIYLNKTCYNGLYRVNRKGHFNAPLGSYKNPQILNESALRSANLALQGVHLETRDFRTIADLANPGDFFYFDPPYVPLSKTASFTGYTAGSFSAQDQRDLAAVFADLSDKGCYCMLSNSYTPFIIEIYRQFRIEIVHAIRAINSDANGRGSIQEVLILNY